MPRSEAAGKNEVILMMKSGSKIRVTILSADFAAGHEPRLLLLQPVLEAIARLDQRRRYLVGAAGAEEPLSESPPSGRSSAQTAVL
jgi:hypothetical protein